MGPTIGRRNSGRRGRDCWVSAGVVEGVKLAAGGPVTSLFLQGCKTRTGEHLSPAQLLLEIGFASVQV